MCVYLFYFYIRKAYNASQNFFFHFLQLKAKYAFEIFGRDIKLSSFTSDLHSVSSFLI